MRLKKKSDVQPGQSAKDQVARRTLMNFNVKCAGFDLTPSIDEVLRQKFEHAVAPLARSTRAISATATLTSPIRGPKSAEFNLNLPGKTIHVKSTDDDLYVAIRKAADQLAAMVIKDKEKLKERHAPSPKRETEELEEENMDRARPHP